MFLCKLRGCRVLVDSKEKNDVYLFVVNEEEEGMVCLELCVEEWARGAETEQCGGGRRLASLLVHLDERLVLSGFDPDGVGLIRFSVIQVHKSGQV